MMKRNDGFTLVELILSISVGTIITAAAVSVLLFGTRINHKTTVSVQQVNATNMLTQIVETAAEGTEMDVILSDNDVTLKGKSGTPKIEYIHSRGEILLNDSVFMEDVTEFTATLSENHRQLTITLITDGKEYSATTYCRLNPTPIPVPAPVPDQGGFPNEP